MKKPNLAIVGASGLVGRTFLKVLEERDFPFENIYMMSSYRSAGKTVTFKGKDYVLNIHSISLSISRSSLQAALQVKSLLL